MTQVELFELVLNYVMHEQRLHEFDRKYDGRLAKTRRRRAQYFDNAWYASAKLRKAISELPIPVGDLSKCPALGRDSIQVDLFRHYTDKYFPQTERRSHGK